MKRSWFRHLLKGAAFTSRNIAIAIGRELLASTLYAGKFAFGAIIGFTLGVAAIQVFWSEFLSIAAGVSKLVIFLLRVFFAFVL